MVEAAPVGHRAARLPWLCPAPASLAAWVDERPSLDVLQADPAVQLLSMRFVRPTLVPESLAERSLEFTSSILLEVASRWIPHSTPQIPADLVAFSHAAAEQARFLAPPALAEAASVAAMLAPLGWFAVAAIDPAAFGATRFAICAGERPHDAQHRLWGLPHDAIVRRLARAWKLPEWLASVIGFASLPPEVSAAFGARPELFAVVVRALGSVRGAASLGFGRGDAESIAPQPPAKGESLPAERAWLVRALQCAARTRKHAATAQLERLARDVDLAVELLRENEEQLARQVETANRLAMAEFAAGAGHEINNPLAVISGNAQLLLASETDESRRASLNTVVRQVRRIADIVTDVMQYARPKPPVPRRFALGEWLARIVTDAQPVAQLKQVRLAWVAEPPETALAGDPIQLAKALGELIRNAVEATAAGGEVRIRCDVTTDCRITVEDDGPGLSAETAVHMFDPFFSGRAAGRGRGLGLPTAWQLARLNGGELRYEPSRGRTGFTLTVPLDVAAPQRRTA